MGDNLKTKDNETQEFNIIFWNKPLRLLYLFFISPIINMYWALFLRVNSEKRARRVIEFNVAFLLHLFTLFAYGFIYNCWNLIIYIVGYRLKGEALFNIIELIIVMPFFSFHMYLIILLQTVKYKRALYWNFYFYFIAFPLGFYFQFVVSFMGVLGIRLPGFGLEFYNTNPLFFLFLGTVGTIVFYLTWVRIFYRGVKAIKFLEKENNSV